MTIDPRFQSLVSDPISSVNKLHGDASYRVYYRLTTTDGKTCIVMQLPEGKSSASEEITNFSGKMKELPFQNVHHFLKEIGIPVPEIISYDPELRLMLIEDCGDELLYTKVAQATDDIQLHWYGKAVELLCTIQKKSSAVQSIDCIALQRSFDATLLNWEFAHFVEYGIEARRGEKLPEKIRKEFDRLTGRISDAIMELPYGFTHRDYQSRNLLICGDKIVVIDFQDALRGPFAYDLVALLRDSYVALNPPVVDKLLAQYAAHRGMVIADVRHAFDLVTIQRKLKDAGRFVYIDRVKKNPNYLQFIPTSLGYVRDAMRRVTEGQQLLELLIPFVPEWQG